MSESFLCGGAWKNLKERFMLDAHIFRVMERESEAPDGRRGRFTLLQAPDWATVIPLVPHENGLRVLMVRQFRHGSEELSLEFPGGIVEPGEFPASAAARELEEETGYKAGTLKPLGILRPNPAFLSNRFHVFLAEACSAGGRMALDENEIIDSMLIPFDEVAASIGTGEYSHALMVAAFFLASRVMGRAVGEPCAKNSADETGALLSLKPMDRGDYALYRDYAIGELAKVYAANYGLVLTEALSKAASEQDEVLPEGPATPGQHLYKALDSSGTRLLGRLWFGDIPDGREAGTAFIFAIDVLPEFRGKGFGLAILNSAATQARGLGYESMRLWVSRDNAAARSLYSKAGFVSIRGDDKGEVFYKKL